jgi:hypothetical protein
MFEDLGTVLLCPRIIYLHMFLVADLYTFLKYLKYRASEQSVPSG